MDHHRALTRAQLKSYQKLAQKKYRKLQGKFIVEGERSVREALRSNWEIEALLLTERAGPMNRYNIYKHIPTYRISERESETLSNVSSSQGVIAVVHQKQISIADLWNNLPSHPILVGLDDVSDPGNVGTIIRISDWFGVDAVFLSNNTVELFNQKVVRAAMGSLFHIPVVSDVDIQPVLSEARSRDFRIIATVVEDGIPLSDFQLPQRAFIILGNEARGVSPILEEVIDIKVSIPRFGSAESLNVGIAAGIVLYRSAMSRTW